ncbi:MAG TPA: dihydropteroate synthase [Methylomirabilota bacterium]|nr:dihydropteroate synthase [Methylomirabilota bacterium]
MRARLGSVDVGEALPVVVMGVINVSPESFHPGSVFRGEAAVVHAAQGMVDAGAELIDVGGRSTAPYLPTEISELEETERLVRAVGALAAKLSVPVSADTTRPAVARAALEAGARVVNDVSALAEPALAREAAAHDASLIVMASLGAGGAGLSETGRGEGPIGVVRRILQDALARARAAGLPDERVVLDPGIGFFRDAGVPWHVWDVTVLAGLPALADLGRPLCVGVSRKSFIGAVTGRERPEDRLAGSLAATAIAVLGGAALVRTHDVRETVDAVRLAERVRKAAR